MTVDPPDPHPLTPAVTGPAIPGPALPGPALSPPAPGMPWLPPAPVQVPPVPPSYLSRLRDVMPVPQRLVAAEARWLLACAAVGALGALVLVPEPFSLAFALVAAAALAVGVAAARSAELTREEFVTSCGLAGLAMALAVVPAISRSPGPVALAVLASAGLAGAAVVPPRTWPAALLAPAVLLVRALQALPWVGGGIRLLVRRVRRLGAAASTDHDPAQASGRRPATAGVLVTLALVVVVGGLLVSADRTLTWALDGFTHALTDLLPDWAAGDLLGRGLLAAVIAGALLVAVHTRLAGHPELPALAIRRRGAGTWGLPLVALIAMLAVFLIVQALTASGFDLVARARGPEYKQRIHEGFGQLIAVSVIVIAVVGWAARLCDRDEPKQRRLLALLGGPVVGLTLGVVGVALSRIYGYAVDDGFTRLRLLVGGFEWWLAGVLVLLASAWFTAVARRLPVLVIAWAGLAVLGVGLFHGDAAVARYNLDRQASTGRLDVAYMAGLSADAVPVMADLPADLRTCALTGWLARQPEDWTASARAGVSWNLAVARASDVLDHPPAAGTCATGRP